MIKEQLQPNDTICELAAGSSHMEAFMQSLPELFEQQGHDTIHHARNILKVMSFEQSEFVVKYFKDLPLIRRFIYTCLRDTKAKRSYLHSVYLKQAHVNTPEPIGYIEFYKNGLVDKTFYVARKVYFDYEFRALLAGDHPDMRAVLPRCAEFVANLHNKGILHADLSPGNILITKKENDYIFNLVDVNRMAFKFISLSEGVNNITRLLIREEIRSEFCHYYAQYRNLDESLVLKQVNKQAQSYLRFRKFKRSLKGMK